MWVIEDSIERLGSLLNCCEYTEGTERALRALIRRSPALSGVAARSSSGAGTLSSTELLILCSISKVAVRHWNHMKDKLQSAFCKLSRAIICGCGRKVEGEAPTATLLAEVETETGAGRWFLDARKVELVSNLFKISDDTLTNHIIDQLAQGDCCKTRAGALLAVRLFTETLVASGTDSDLSAGQVKCVVRCTHMLLKPLDGEGEVPSDDALLTTLTGLLRALTLSPAAAAAVEARNKDNTEGNGKGGENEDKGGGEVSDAAAQLVEALTSWSEADTERRPSFVGLLAHVAHLDSRHAAAAYVEGTALLTCLTDPLSSDKMAPIMPDGLIHLAGFKHCVAREYADRGSVSAEGLDFLSAFWDFCLKMHVFGTFHVQPGLEYEPEVVGGGATEDAVPHSSLTECCSALFDALLVAQRGTHNKGVDRSNNVYSFPYLKGHDEMMLSALRIVTCHGPPLIEEQTPADLSLSPCFIRRTDFFLTGVERVRSSVAATRATTILLTSLRHKLARKLKAQFLCTARQVARIGATFPAESLDSVVTTLVDTAARIGEETFSYGAAREQYEPYLQAIYQALAYVAQQLKTEADSTHLLRMRHIVITKFISFAGGEVCGMNRGQLLVLVAALRTVIVPSSAAVTERRAKDDAWEQKDQQTNRELWVALTILRHGHAESEWTLPNFDALAGDIAVHCEALVQKRRGASVGLLSQDELYLRTIRGVDTATAALLRDRVLPKTSHVKKLKSHYVYLPAAMVYLERMRATSNLDFVTTFEYLDDEGIACDGRMEGIYCELAEHVFCCWVEEVHAQLARAASSGGDVGRTDAVDAAIERTMERALCACFQLDQQVHLLGLRLADAIGKNFEWFLQRASCVKFMLDALGEMEAMLLHLRSDGFIRSAELRPEEEEGVFMARKGGAVRLLDVMPYDAGLLDARSEKLLTFVYTWLCSGRRKCPKFVVSMLQEYVITAQDRPIATAYDGIANSIAHELIRSPVPVFHLNNISNGTTMEAGAFARSRRSAAQNVSAAATKALLAGTADSNTSLFDVWGAAVPFPDIALKLTKTEHCASFDFDSLLAHQEELLAAGHGAVEADVVASMWSCVSTLRSVKAPLPTHCVHRVLRNCCLLLQHHLTVEVAAAFVQCWEWLACYDRSNIYILLALVVEVLKATRVMALGIFEHTSLQYAPTECCHEDVALFTTSAAQMAQKAMHVMFNEGRVDRQSHLPHALLIDFLNEHSHLGDTASLETVFGCLEALLASPTAFSRDPGACTAKFALLTVGIRALHRAMHTRNAPTVHRRRILRERIYRCALEHFNGPSQWGDAVSNALGAVVEFKCLYQFMELVTSDVEYWPVDYADEDSGGSLFFVEREPTLGGAARHDISSNGYVGTQDTPALLQLLLLSELNRLIAWHCDGHNQNLRTEEFCFDANHVSACLASYNMFVGKTGYVSDMFAVCWSVSPPLALRMRERFHCLVDDPLCRDMVGFFPQAVRGSHGAATLLVEFHKHATDQDLAIPAIDELSMFQPVSGPEAIGILNRCSADGRETPRRKNEVVRSPHSVPRIIRFVIRSLRSLPPATQEFYLPQLLQLLRRDIFGAIAELVVKMSTRNVVLSHQCTWLLQTESVREVEKGGKPNAVETHHGLCNSIAGPDALPFIARGLLRRTMDSLTPEARNYVGLEVTYFNKVCSISARLLQVKDKTRHGGVIRDALNSIPMPSGLYLPTRPTARIVGVDVDTGYPMQSAAKCPFMLTLFAKEWAGPDAAKAKKRETVPKTPERLDSRGNSIRKHVTGNGNGNGSDGVDVGEGAARTSRQAREGTSSRARISPLMDYLHDLQIRERAAFAEAKKQSLVPTKNNSYPATKPGITRESCDADPEVSCVNIIFKVFDDCRQDLLTVQVMRLLRDVFKAIGTPLYLRPYTIIPNRTGADQAIGGIIECLENVLSRDQIGKNGAKTLLQHYVNKFGLPHSQEFRRAQQNFACSLAGYAVACHILSIKDRHNGNILFTEDGHMCHIDYGFLLGISPGGNLGFENASFKLTGEMLELLGGHKSELFSTFMSLTIRGFLAARQVMEPLLVVVAAMADSGLPCFMHKANNLAKLRARFVPELSDTEAARYIKGRVLDAKNKWTTRAYDGIQKLQQNIYSDTWL